MVAAYDGELIGKNPGVRRALRHYWDDQTIDVGVGSDRTIADLARQIATVVGHGEIAFETAKPDGTRESSSIVRVCRHWAGDRVPLCKMVSRWRFRGS